MVQANTGSRDKPSVMLDKIASVLRTSRTRTIACQASLANFPSYHPPAKAYLVRQDGCSVAKLKKSFGVSLGLYRRWRRMNTKMDTERKIREHRSASTRRFLGLHSR